MAPHAGLAPPGPDEVHVWAVRLDVDPSRVRARERSLPPAERRRAAGYRRQPRKLRYVARQLAVRALVERYGDHPLELSVSDSHDLALVAVVTRRRVGVDVEWANGRRHGERIARRLYSRDEQQALSRLAGDAAHEELLRRWTAREAWCKAAGVTLGRTLRLFAAGEITVDGLERGDGGWTLQPLDVERRYVASLVVAADARPVVCLRWLEPSSGLAPAVAVR